MTSGSGSLEAGGRVAAVGPEHGVALPPGANYRLTAEPAPREAGVLVVDIVTLPAAAGPEASPPGAALAAAARAEGPADAGARRCGSPTCGTARPR